MPELDGQIANIDIGIYKRPYRRVGVERFAAAKLLFGFLQIAIADVEADRVTKNEIERAFRRYIFRRCANHDRQFQFEIGLMLGKRDLDRAVMRQKRAGRFEPNQRCAERGAFHFRNVICVIEADRDQL